VRCDFLAERLGVLLHEFEVELLASARLFSLSCSGQDFNKKKVFSVGLSSEVIALPSGSASLMMWKFEVEAVASATLFSQTT